MKKSFLRNLPFVVLVTLGIVAILHAEEPPPTPPDVGFRSIEESAAAPSCKVGFWVPLHVRFSDRSDPLDFIVSAEDSEDHLVRTRTPFPRFDGPPNPPTWKSVPVKFGRLSNAIRAGFCAPGDPHEHPFQPLPYATAGIGSYMYLTIGGKLEDLPAALVSKERRAEEEGTLRDFVPNRFAVFENNVERLPRRSLEYDTADLAIFLTGDDRFVDRLKVSGSIRPLLQWVKDGGRLVVSLSPATASRVEAMIHDFESPGKPYEPPSPRSTTVRKLVPVEAWAGLSNKPFPTPGSPPVPVVRLGPGPRWESIAKLGDDSLVIATRPFGFGSLSVIAFPLDGAEFVAWAGRQEFLRTLVDQLGPRYRMPEKTKSPLWRAGGRIDDLGTELNIALDNFDVPRLPFGLIAFAILGYLLLAGPIDYLLLRRLFGRLEWTWLTYPLIVLVVSGLAYVTYRSTSDRVVLVDRVDLVDVHLADGVTRGTSFFAVRSPDLRALSLELAPNERFLGPGKLADVALSWFGRPDDGPAGMGRAGTQSFSRKEYEQSPDLAHLHEVPFADRASKAFLA
ncbi:MAG TPA: hypothetical protein VHR72_00760, partial [Gemmataceae bacterium]|nr:hypothetical protein [Gemmataceae bacterium]